MGKLFPRMMGLFPKLEGGKNQVGSEAEVGMSTKCKTREISNSEIRAKS